MGIVLVKEIEDHGLRLCLVTILTLESYVESNARHLVTKAKSVNWPTNCYIVSKVSRVECQLLKVFEPCVHISNYTTAVYTRFNEIPKVPSLRQMTATSLFILREP